MQLHYICNIYYQIVARCFICHYLLFRNFSATALGHLQGARQFIDVSIYVSTPTCAAYVSTT